MPKIMFRPAPTPPPFVPPTPPTVEPAILFNPYPFGVGVTVNATLIDLPQITNYDYCYFAAKPFGNDEFIELDLLSQSSEPIPTSFEYSAAEAHTETVEQWGLIIETNGEQTVIPLKLMN